MVDIIVREGEYEYLMETDPKFREFVLQCEGKTIEEILKVHNVICHNLP